VGAGPGGSNYGQYILVLNAAGQNVVASDINNELADDKARAVFGQATWTPTGLSALHITGGVRYNWEEKHGIVHTISPVTRQRIPAAEVNQTRKWTKTTYKLNAAYDIRPENMVYVDHSTGFKSGGFAYGVNAAYNPEFLDSWEIGTKNRFLDNRLQVNASAWKYDYTDQVTTIPQFYFDPLLVPVNGTGVANTITTVNAGNSEIKGQSVDVSFAITRNDSLNLNVQHIDSKYNKFDLTQLYTQLHYFAWCTAQPDGATPTGGCVGGNIINLQPGISTTGDQNGPSVNYNGTRAGANPEWAGTLSYSHTFRGMGADWDAQASYYYFGERLNGNQAAPFTSNYYLPLDAYSTIDLSLRYRPTGAKWSVLAYVRNVGDKLYRVARGFTSNNAGAQYNPATLATTLNTVNYALTTAAYGPPRTFGIVFDTSF
jgi:iron complex outermembrane receptor protein